MASKRTVDPKQKPRIGNPQIHLLERLCLASGVSGDESEVRAIIQENIKAHADEVRTDAIGNILAIRKGSGRKRLKVMLAAHMDEVGFMIIHDEGDGIFRFDIVGSIDVRQLVGKPVWVGREHLPGVIGVTPIHLTSAEERKKAVSLDALRIDVGIQNGKKVKVGDRATFATPFSHIGPSLRAKALDDRLGVTTLIEILKNAPLNIDLQAAFTVQEEVGQRGAQVAAYNLDPHLAFVLDCTPAKDLPAWNRSTTHLESGNQENFLYNTCLGAGPAIYVADKATFSDPRLIRFLVDIAESQGIPYQIRQPGGGSTDAAGIHKQRSGIPSVSVSVPGRYLHTAASIVRMEDWKNSLALVHNALSNLKPDILVDER